MFIKLRRFAIESALLKGGRGLHFNWRHGKAAGIGNSNNFMGVPTAFGGHCSEGREFHAQKNFL